MTPNLIVWDNIRVPWRPTAPKAELQAALLRVLAKN